MSDFIYYCPKCVKFNAFKSKTGSFKCPDCGGEFSSLGVTVGDWNNYTNDEMLDVIEKAKKPVVIKEPVFNNAIEVEQAADIPVQPDPEPEARQIKPKPDKKKTMIVGIVVAGVVVLLCVIGGIYYAVNRTSIIQKKIDKCVRIKEWDDAISYCESIDDQKQLNELKYKKGMDAADDDLIVAIDTLSEIADLYPDAKKKLDELISFKDLKGVYEYESSENGDTGRKGNIEVNTFIKDGKMIAAYEWSLFGTDGYASGPYREVSENKEEDRQYNITRIISYQFLPDGRLRVKYIVDSNIGHTDETHYYVKKSE